MLNVENASSSSVKSKGTTKDKGKMTLLDDIKDFIDDEYLDEKYNNDEIDNLIQEACDGGSDEEEMMMVPMKSRKEY
ncbi:hypothetical protein M5689_016921 [Euphorbia peplus]|nr:hypothetical protein M5689_016921 [Euphorbia peplus]